MKRTVAVLVTLALAAGPALASPDTSSPAADDAAANEGNETPLPVMYGDPGFLKHVDKVVPSDPRARAADPVSPIIFMNRCKGGCTVHTAGRDDARTNESSIPQKPDGTDVTIPEFPWSDDVWNQFMGCIKEVYSPYNVTVTDVDPGTNTVHHEVIVAGSPTDVGLSQGIGGIAPVAGDCLPKNNNISYAFAAVWPPSEVLELCATAAQETTRSI